MYSKTDCQKLYPVFISLFKEKPEEENRNNNTIDTKDNKAMVLDV